MPGLVTGGLGYGGLVTGGLGFQPVTPAPPGVVAVEPDPAETAFTLGFGGATWDGKAAPGFNLALAAQVLNNAAPLAYDPSDTLDAVVWRGGDEAALFSPAVAWDPANGGAPSGRFTLAIGAGQTAALDAGSYRLRVGVTVAGVRSLVYDGRLELADAPGAEAPGQSWCSYDDLLLYSDQIRSIKGPDKTGFLGQRQRATAELSRDVVLRYESRPGMTRIRSATYDPVFGYDQPTTTAPPTKAVIATALAAGGIILEARLREIVARRALAIILGRSFNNPQYMAEAKYQQGMADDQFRAFLAQIDVDGDGTPDFEIGVDAIILPAGAAP